jgi:hypothetical protein
MSLTPSMQAAGAFLSARKACHELAITAEKAIEQLPETHANQYVVLEALIRHFNEARGCDYSLVLERLQDAQDALDEVRAFSDEEIADWAREHMEDQRRVA